LGDFDRLTTAGGTTISGSEIETGPSQMNKRTSVFARILAALALAAAAVAVVLAVSSGVNDSSSPNSGHGAQTAKHEAKHHRTKAKTYTVQTGDTLIAIAHKTGISIAEIKVLNPEVDPQILIAGETLKLR
jgi:LysM repeat protein